MIKRLFRYTGIFVTVLAIGLLQIMPAYADGGIVIQDHDLWAMIAEGQQIAVIQLGKDDMVKIDLFITMLDRSGESHEVVFFVPLGEQAINFNVTEESSLDFDGSLTRQLDDQLEDYARLQANYQTNVKASLLLGTIATNGLWSGFVIVPLLLSSCSGAPAPVATYQTESSLISIYAMNEKTDIQALIQVTGLDEGVKSTLEDLQGQQIAVVRLQTKPTSDTSDSQTGFRSAGQPGIHLGWETQLVRYSDQASYTYPLGTGRAWASPIELTRVYIVVPPEVDLEAQYPRLGDDLSGIGSDNGRSGLVNRLYWRVDQAQGPAYAIDKAFGSFGQIWRFTYIKSNSDRDLNIIKKAEVSPETQSAIRRSQSMRTVTGFTWLIGLIVGVIIWLFAWWLVMSRVLKAPWRGKKLWGGAFLWCLIYPGFILAALVLAGLAGYGILWLLVELLRVSDILSSTLLPIFLGMLSLPSLLAIAGVVNAFFFARSQAKKLSISRWRAFGGYFLVVLMANLIYLLFSQAYAILAGTV